MINCQVNANVCFCLHVFEYTNHSGFLNIASWNDGNIPQLRGTKWFSFEDVKQCTSGFSLESQIGVGGYGKVDAVTSIL